MVLCIMPYCEQQFMQCLIPVGLAIDIAGFLLIALSAHANLIVSNRPPDPKKWKDGDIWFNAENGDKERETRYRILRYNRRVGIGTGLVVFGFLLQFLGSVL